MAIPYTPVSQRPLSEINTTPLIDVLLVLLVMLVVTIPIATHSIDVDIPAIGRPIEVRPLSNRVNLDPDGDLS